MAKNYKRFSKWKYTRSMRGGYTPSLTIAERGVKLARTAAKNPELRRAAAAGAAEVLSRMRRTKRRKVIDVTSRRLSSKIEWVTNDFSGEYTRSKRVRKSRSIINILFDFKLVSPTKFSYTFLGSLKQLLHQR